MTVTRVLSIVPAYMPTVYILLKPLQALAATGEIVHTVLLESEVTRAHVLDADCVHFIRNSDPTASAVYRMVVHLGVPYIFELDDNLLAIPGESPVAKYHQSPAVKGALEYLLTHAHLVRAYSPVLREVTAAYNPASVFVVPAIDWSLMPSALPPVSHRPFRIVYPTSRVSDDPFYAQFWPDVRRLMDEAPGEVEMHFFGFVPPEAAGLPGVVYHPQMKYTDFMAAFTSGGYALGLAPMLTDHFYQCKTNNKFREFAAAGIVGVYLDTPLYAQSVTHGVNGFLIDGSPGSWYPVLRAAFDHPDALEVVRQAARTYAEAHYSLEPVVETWREHLASLPVAPYRVQQRPQMHAAAPARPLDVLALVTNISPSSIIDLAPLEYLAQYGAITFRQRLEREVTPAEIFASDVIVGNRNMYAFFRPHFELAARVGIPIIYDLDDNLLDAPQHIVKPADYDYISHPANQATLRWLLTEADMVRVYSPPLGEVVAPFNGRVWVGIPAFDWSLIPLHLPPLPDGPLRIVYATGRGAHDPIFDQIADEVIAAADTLGDAVEWHFYGKRADDLPAGLRDRSNVVFAPFTDDYAGFVRALCGGGYAIGLAPMPGDFFYQCKANAKQRDYAAAGAVGLFSDQPIYQRTVQHAVNGLLVADTPGAWTAAICDLVADRAQIERLRTAARRDVEALCNIETQAETWLDQVITVTGGRPLPLDQRAALAAVGLNWAAHYAPYGDDPAAPLIHASPLYLPPATDVTAIIAPHINQPLTQTYDLPSISSSTAIVSDNLPPVQPVLLSEEITLELIPKHGNWAGISLMIGTHGKVLSGTLAVTVRTATGAIIRQASRPLAEATDNAWLGFSFQSIAHASGQPFTVTVQAHDLPPGGIVSVYAGSQAAPPALGQRISRRLGRVHSNPHLSYLLHFAGV